VFQGDADVEDPKGAFAFLDHIEKKDMSINKRDRDKEQRFLFASAPGNIRSKTDRAIRRTKKWVNLSI